MTVRLLHLKRSLVRIIEMEIQTFVFIDCETTGLPSHEYNRTRITELSFAAVERRHLLSGAVPRVQNKLNLCFNPCRLVDPVSTRITGLSNDLLEYQPTFSADVVDAIKSFMALYRKPTCLVAHNGFDFDFPVLRAELIRADRSLADDLLCCDSLEIFRELHERGTSRPESKKDFILELLEEIERSERVLAVQNENERTPPKKAPDACRSQPATPKRLKFGDPSFKLGDVYERLTKKKACGAHHADVDVALMLECAVALGEGFASSADESARLFCDVRPINAGRTNRT